MFKEISALLESVQSDISSTAITPETHPDGFYSDGIWQSVIWKDGKPFRQRVEIMIFDDAGRLYMEKLENDDRGRVYRFPGGSSENYISLAEAVIKEAEEEARLKVEDVIYSGFEYTEIYNDVNRPGWHQILKNSFGFVYEGVINVIYKGEYHGEFKGYIEEHDTDDQMFKNGKFYELAEIMDILDQHHKDAII